MPVPYCPATVKLFAELWAKVLKRADHDGVLGQSASISLCLHLVKDLLDVKRGRFLPLRKFSEAHKELSNDGLRRDHDPELVAIPTSIHLGIRRHLEWVHPKV